jgi:hypothetical protein
MVWDAMAKVPPENNEEGLLTETTTEEVVVNKNQLTYCRCVDVVQHSVRLKSFSDFQHECFARTSADQEDYTFMQEETKHTKLAEYLERWKQ